jgi:very-short-patch-repair endonuclease
MILNKTAELKINASNYKHFDNLGYKNLKCSDKIDVPVKHLTKGSNVKIDVKCDVCGKEKTLSYKNYNKNIKNQNYYSCSQKCASEKKKITNIKKYGVKYPNQNKDIRKKSKQTNLDRHGVEYPAQNKEIYKKIKQTNLERYGAECSLKNEEVKGKIKQTNLDRYDVENPAQNKEIYKKIKQTMIERYGVEYSMQNKDIHEKQQRSGLLRKKYNDTNIHYQGTYEKHFLDFCFENNIIVENGPSVKYLFEGKSKIYHSDFYLEEKNLIIEIKSDYYYNKYLDKNLAKQKSCIQQGYDFIFLINKEYDEFLKTI